MDYIKLIRPLNLAFLAILISLIFYAVINPILNKYGIELENSTLIYSLLLSSTIFIAAGGYVVNDYFDTKIDQINRPLKVIVGKSVSRNAAAILFQVLFGIGIICGLVLAYIVKDYSLGFIYIVIPGLLWFYSSSYKRQLIIGNLMIALCAFLSCFTIAYAVNASLINKYGELIYLFNSSENSAGIVPEIYYWAIGFGIFAFLMTFIREIVKDIEDIEGDRELECHTIPVVWGTSVAKTIIAALSIITLLLAGYFAILVVPMQFRTDEISFKYFTFGIAIPLLILVFWIGKASKVKEFQQISTFVKYIMFIGTLYALVVYYLFITNYHYL